MNIIVYSRVSTDKQTLEQQERTVNEWLTAHSLTPTHVISDEGVSGGITYQKRRLGTQVLPLLRHGDILIVSEISRIGRSMSDINRFVSCELRPRGVRLVIVKMGLDLDCAKMKAIDEMILFSFSFAAQVEKELIQERTQSAIDARKQRLADDGSFISKKGQLCTRLGNPTHEGIMRAADASCRSRRERARNDPNNRRIWQIICQHTGGELPTTQQVKDITLELNARDMRTATNLAFNVSRTRNCYHTLKKIYA